MDPVLPSENHQRAELLHEELTILKNMRYQRAEIDAAIDRIAQLADHLHKVRNKLRVLGVDRPLNAED